MDKSEALLDLHHIQRSLNSTSLQSKKVQSAKMTPSKVSTTGGCFSGEIKSARFYYNDKFVTLSNGPKIYMYSYGLEKPDLQSIRPGSNHNSYKLVNMVVSESQAITSFTCANSYKSHLLIGASTNKSCLIWDLNMNRLMRTLPDAHSRWIHDVAIADYEFVPSSFENVFLTTAVTDGIKAWDLRTQKSVMHLSGHVNRACAIRTCLSPCGRFIATGSEVSYF
jgi:WD40 repeat protein